MNITKKNIVYIMGIISLIISSLGLISGVIFWIFPFKEISENESFVIIKENFYLFFISTFVLIILSLILLLLNKRANTKNEEWKTTITNKERETLINSLKKRYEERYKQKLDNNFPINLEFQNTLKNVREKPSFNLFSIKNEETIRAELVDLFEKYSFLLILGESGIGKTSQLLNLGIGLLKKCEKNDTLPIPIILNLATYTNKYEQFEDWLQSNLVSMYDFPPKVVTNSLKDNKIIFLFDGFDEIGNYLENEEEKKELRVKCFNSIQKYKTSEFNPRQFVICSRISEYEQIKNSAPLTVQIIEVKKPKMEQIKNNLKKTLKESDKNSEKEAVQNLLILLNKKSIVLQEVLCIPFYYNALLQILHTPQDKNTDFPNDIDKLKEFIVNLYIERKLYNNNSTKYTIEKTKKYLVWLSIWLKKQSKVNFELVDFQPSCLTKKRLLYSFIVKLPFSILLFIIFQYFFVNGITKKFNLNTITTNIIIAVSCLIIGFFLSGRNKIETKEIFKWNWKNMANLENWIITLIVCIFCITPIFFLNYVIFGYFSFLYNFILFLFIYLYTTYSYWFDIYHYTSIKKPYDRLNNIKFNLLNVSFYVIGFVFICTMFTIPYRNLFILFPFAIYILFFDLPLFYHFILNYCLWKEKSMTFPMVPFFTYCTKLRILETDGGSWRFRHQMLQDYFCNQK
jgi:hypothetical protein